jgi:cell division septation protein DedD/nucleoid DNA-binding protein
MTKTELIGKIAKNVGVPDTDAKIFFELFLKRISAVIAVGQSIFVKDFGYFHLINGSIKRPSFGFADSEVSEESVEFVLFSEDKDLRNSETKGLVFNIPFFDEEDYHPIDSAFSLSIGKPLIPLRGVPFDNIYMPASGYEYRRLIESKVEKIIGSSEIAQSEENFPILVIDARSYNSNLVQLKWDDKSRLDTIEKQLSDEEINTDVKPELSEYEKQTKELKNIAWDFGEDLSKQIEAESILDIADERINMDNAPKQKIKIVEDSLKIEKESAEINLVQEDLPSHKDLLSEPESVEEITLDKSSEKLNELLENENEPTEIYQQTIIEQNIDENLVDYIAELNNEIGIEHTLEQEKSDLIDNVSIAGEISDEEFWKSTSKYFEPYKPNAENKTDEEFEEVKANFDNLGMFDSKDSEQKIEDEIRDVIESNIEIDDNDSILEESAEENEVDVSENFIDESNEEHKIELEKIEEQKVEYFEPVKKKNLIPFIVFPLLVIGLSLALYWYLEFYKKSEITTKPIQLALKTDNTKIVQRNFDIPVTYPYLPKVNETSFSETIPPKNEDQNLAPEKNESVKTEPVNSEIKKVEKETPKQIVTDTKKPVTPVVPTGKSLNVGNNIYKYGNYFVVQVAAFRSSSISENEAGKYRNKGYNAFVEAAEIPGRGIWYRVRVGNFNSKEEALIFANKNIR